MGWEGRCLIPHPTSRSLSRSPKSRLGLHILHPFIHTHTSSHRLPIFPISDRTKGASRTYSFSSEMPCVSLVICASVSVDGAVVSREMPQSACPIGRLFRCFVVSLFRCFVFVGLSDGLPRVCKWTAAFNPMRAQGPSSRSVTS